MSRRAILAAIAALLLVIFQGDVHLLIPLYSVGVFVCFTLSQVGMVRHWRAVRDAGWRWRATVNAFGALLTLTVLIVVASVKFSAGAWLVVVLIPLQVGVFLFIHRQYRASAAQLAVRPDAHRRVHHDVVQVLAQRPGVVGHHHVAVPQAVAAVDDQRMLGPLAVNCCRGKSLHPQPQPGKQRVAERCLAIGGVERCRLGIGRQRPAQRHLALVGTSGDHGGSAGAVPAQRRVRDRTGAGSGGADLRPAGYVGTSADRGVVEVRSGKEADRFGSRSGWSVSRRPAVAAARHTGPASWN